MSSCYQWARPLDCSRQARPDLNSNLSRPCLGGSPPWCRSFGCYDSILIMITCTPGNSCASHICLQTKIYFTVCRVYNFSHSTLPSRKCVSYVKTSLPTFAATMLCRCQRPATYDGPAWTRLFWRFRRPCICPVTPVAAAAS